MFTRPSAEIEETSF